MIRIIGFRNLSVDKLEGFAADSPIIKGVKNFGLW